MQGWATFDTPIGDCGIAWGERGLTGINLPEGTAAATRDRLRRRFPGVEEGEAPAVVADVMAALRRLLAGARSVRVMAQLDREQVTDFDWKVYQAARAIPMGQTVTYGAMAAGLGDPGLSRAVGQSLGRNPWPILIPCHRIVSAGGGKGGFSAFGGAGTKMRLLAIEGALGEESLPLFAARP